LAILAALRARTCACQRANEDQFIGPKDPAIKAIVETAQDRPGELRKAVGEFGGKVHHFFYAFGAYDGIAIVEFPDNESCAACSLTLAGAGGTVVLTTTVLLTAAEGHRAMKKASAAETGYQAPVGYSSHG
jgi:uncharacterized protein with GYD domain